MNFCKKKSDQFYIFVGSIILLLCYIFFLISGEEIIVNMHDQLDGEIVYYMLRAKSLRSVLATEFPQFMDGNAEVTVASFGTLLFYLVSSPVYAFISNMFFIRLVAFISLFYLLRKYDVEKEICFLVAMVFSFLPLYSVYGLSCMGIPLVWLSVIYLSEGKNKFGLGGIALYGIFSSLVLAGFAVLTVFIIYIVVQMLLRRKNMIGLIWGFLELTFIYVITNINLIKLLILKDSSFLSHKTDYKLTSSSFWSEFTEILINGQFHAVSLHKYIIPVILVTSCLIIVKHKKVREHKVLKKQFEVWVILISLIVMIAMIHAAFLSEIGRKARIALFSGSALLGFQFDRVYWLYPALWYVVFGISLSIVYNLLKNGINYCLAVIISGILWCVPAMYVAKYSDITHNFMSGILNKDQADTWENVYAEDLYSEIADYIDKDQSSYHVVSIGIHPSVALYNGFYCLDGYSNNYDLAYKRQFGEMMQSELEKNESISHYFWDWGNRCYLYPAELEGNCFLGKDNGYSIDLDIDINALKQMGGNYIFSAVNIDNADELGLDFKKYFENENSYYGIYLYEIEG